MAGQEHGHSKDAAYTQAGHTDSSQQIHIILFIILVDLLRCFLVGLFWGFFI